MPAPTPPPAESGSGDAVGRKSFEDALDELEDIVGQLEAGSKPLDESLALYEKGVGALKHCHSILDKAEKRIRILVRNAQGEPELREAEIPDAGAGKKPSARRAEPVAEVVTGDIVVDSKNSTQLTVDSDSPPRQNLPPSVKPKPRTTPGKPDAAGGSLFGSSQ